MTGPLVVLGVLSVVGGVLNLPHFVGGHAALERWLEPVIAPARRVRPAGDAARVDRVLPGRRRGRSSASLGLFARLPRHAGAADPDRAARRRRTRGLARVLNRKYYVDELYDAVDRPAARVALPRGALEGRGPGRGGRRGGQRHGLAVARPRLAGQPAQTGQVGVYVVLFLVGALWILRAVIR